MIFSSVPALARSACESDLSALQSYRTTLCPFSLMQFEGAILLSKLIKQSLPLQRLTHILPEERHHNRIVLQPRNSDSYLFRRKQHTVAVLSFTPIPAVVHVSPMAPPHMTSLAKGSKIFKPVICTIMIQMHGGKRYTISCRTVWFAMLAKAPLTSTLCALETDQTGDQAPFWMI
jgi:hypothetical protein